MSRPKKTSLLVFTLTLATVVVSAALYLRSDPSLAQVTSQEPNAELPITDYDAPEPADKAKREKRRSKGRKYDKADFPVDPSLGENIQVETSHWFYGLPALPTAQSEVVLIGDVVSADAFLSQDKSGVYSEYGVRVSEVLKTDDPTISSNCTVEVERRGGRVRLPSGKIQKYVVLNQGALRVGQRYALFLRRNQQDLQVVTGYELRQNTVKPIDSVTLFERYKNADVQSFLDTLRRAISFPESPPGNEYAMEPIDDEPPDPEADPGATPCAAPTPGDCMEPPPTNAPRLKPNQAYTVTIDPTGFSSEKVSAIIRGFEQWNARSGTNGTNTGTTFVGFIQTTEAPSDTCLYCFHVRGDYNVQVDGKPADAKTGWDGVQGSPNTIGIARMVIDFKVPIVYTSYVEMSQRSILEV